LREFARKVRNVYYTNNKSGSVPSSCQDAHCRKLFFSIFLTLVAVYLLATDADPLLQNNYIAGAMTFLHFVLLNIHDAKKMMEMELCRRNEV